MTYFTYVTCELDVPEGRILRTRISHPVDRSDYGASLWWHILRDQLEVTAAGFWQCVDAGVPPDRGVPEIPESALPADVVHLLITRVGPPEQQVAAMTRQEAIARLQHYRADGT